MSLDPVIWQIVCAFFGIISVILIGLVAYLFKGMNDTIKLMGEAIKDLERKEQATAVFMSEIQGGKDAQKALQDERWENLKINIERLQRALEAIIHAELGNSNKQKATS